MSSNGLLRNPDSVRYRAQVGFRPSPAMRRWLLKQMVQTGLSLNQVVESIIGEAMERDGRT